MKAEASTKVDEVSLSAAEEGQQELSRNNLNSGRDLLTFFRTMPEDEQAKIMAYLKRGMLWSGWRHNDELSAIMEIFGRNGREQEQYT